VGGHCPSAPPVPPVAATALPYLLSRTLDCIDGSLMIMNDDSQVLCRDRVASCRDFSLDLDVLFMLKAYGGETDVAS
jgi:hypothetical protein